MDVALSRLDDIRGLRASLAGVDAVFHLAGAERLGTRGDLLQTDVVGTRTVAEAALEAGVKRLVFLSHLGASRSSAYPMLKAKAIAEEHIRRSGVPFLILRSASAYGMEDHFTTSLAMLLAAFPAVVPIPGDGSSLLQPLWVEELALCLAWGLDEEFPLGHTYEIGGPEYLSLTQVLEMVMLETGMRRLLIPTRPPYLRTIVWLMEHALRFSPVTVFWLDYLAVNRACELDTLPRVFGLQPSRMERNLGYLRGRKWLAELVRRQFATH